MELLFIVIRWRWVIAWYLITTYFLLHFWGLGDFTKLVFSYTIALDDAEFPF
jgi:hypothetical protein